MKRFFIISLFFSLVVALSSCEKSTEDIQTTLSVKIPVSVEEADSVTTTKSALIYYSFSDSLVESLEDNDILISYLDQLKRIEVNKVNIEIIGLQGNQTIENVEVKIEGIAQTIATINDISPNTPDKLNYFPEINSSVLVQIANLLYATQQLKVIVSGTTNDAPMDFSVNTYFNLNVEASPL